MEQQLLTLKSTTENQLLVLQQETDQTVQNLQDKYDIDINTLKTNHSEEVKTLRSTLQSEFNVTLDNSVKDAISIENKKHVLLIEEKVRMLQQEHAVVIEKLNKEHSSVLEQVHKEHSIALEAKIKEIKNECEIIKTNAINQLQTEFNNQQQVLIESHQLALENEKKTILLLQKDITTLQTTMTEQITIKVQEMELILQNQHKADIERIRLEKQSLIDKAVAEKEEFCQLYTKEYKLRKAIHNKLLDIQGNIRVICRVRPMLEVEKKSGEDNNVTEFLPHNPDEIIINRDSCSRNKFEYDRVFAPTSQQGEVFEMVQPLCVSVLDGYNICIFAYGQTGKNSFKKVI